MGDGRTRRGAATTGCGTSRRRGGARTRAALLAVAAAWAAAAAGQVVINELSAANSDRQLKRDGSGYPAFGTTPQWYEPSFDDALWSTGNGPFGFGSFAGVTYGVNVSALMQNKVPTLYVRKAFVVTAGQAASSEPLELLTRFNDGFVAFLNGVEVARRNMGNPGMIAYRDQTAFNTNAPPAALQTIGLGAASARLTAGTNLLCIQTHNKAVTSGDFLSMADLRIGGAAPVTLVANNGAWRYFAGVYEPSGGVIDYGLLSGVPLTASWATLAFNDSAWPQGTGPFGYDTKVPPPYALGVNLKSEMYGLAASLYSRTLFTATAAEAASAEPLQLVVDYDDGLIVFLNGREVARRNVGTAGTVTPYNALAAASHSADGVGETIVLGPANTLLAGGDNVLGLQVHNVSLTSSDLIGRVTVSTTGAGARTLARPTDAGRYFVGTSEPQTGAGGEEDEEDEVDLDEDTPDSESDWIELRNLGAEAVNLTGWSLTDDEGKPRKWSFPAGSAIPAGGYLLVMATGFDVGPEDGATYLHANFKLSKSGEYLGLVDAGGAIASELAPTYPRQHPFYTYARTEGGAYVFCATATPGVANAGATYAAIAQPPDFSHLGGFYAAGILLQMAAPDPQAEVRYTTDGSEPTASSARADAPLSITATTALRARCFNAGEVPSATVSHTYLIGQSAARRSIPAFCVTGDPALSLYGPNSGGGPAVGEGVMAVKGGAYNASGIWQDYGDMGAFNMPIQKGRSSERPVGFEFYPTNGAPLRTDLGLRISGSPHARPRYKITQPVGSRFHPTSFVDKPSYNIFFRGELGESPQSYPFFPDSPVTQFEDMRVRAGKNDLSNPFLRDELARRIFIGTGQQGSIGSFVSLYINGVWKGYYNFCEHLREAFMRQHHNSEALWDVRQVAEFASGDTLHWNTMMSYMKTNNFATVEAYAGMAEYADLDNVIDYLLCNAYMAMWDWPHNNWVAARERSPAGRWRFYMWDAEGCFGMAGRTTSYNSFTTDLIKSGSTLDNSNYGAAIFYSYLRFSPEFRLRFADRAQRHLFNSGCLTKSSMQAVFLQLRNTINPIMQETISQTVNESFYYTWIVDDTRRNVFFGQLTDQGLWPATLAPLFSQHGGTVAPDTAIAISNPNGAGSVYFTTNGVDPRALGGAVAGDLYTAPLVLGATTTLKARVLGSGGAWSPLQEAFFLVPVDVPTFVPAGSADWTADANWTSAPLPYPNGTNVAVFLNAPDTADRDINLRAPVTVGDVTFRQNDSAYRNRLRDRSSGNTLTFAATNGPARLTVDGFGTGYAELEVEADVVLASDLRIEVNSTAGHDDYGALRLRANWRGPGGVIKEGDGVATYTGDAKSYAGETVINQGVLQMTQPAAPGSGAGVRVTDGGQLRLTSASTEGVPRVYVFGGALTLDSLGRGGTLPPSGQGVSGALRYQPETDNSAAVVSNDIAFAGLSGLHVEGSRNTLELAGALSGAGGFVKSGGGNLILSADSRRYLAPAIINNGTVTVHGRITSAVQVSAGGVLAGTGRTGPLSGAGTVALDRTVLRAPFATGLNYAFSFAATGSPAYADRAACSNGVLRVLTLHAGDAPATVDLYLDLPDLREGDTLRGGFFVEAKLGLMEFLEQAAVRYFVPDVNGLQSFAGRTYSLYEGPLPLAVTAMPETADFGDGPREGLVMEVRVAGAPVNYDEWVARYYALPADQLSVAVADPASDPSGEGMSNLMRYAFGVGPGDELPAFWPSFSVTGEGAAYRFRFDPGKRDLAYRVEASSDLRVWDRVLFDSREQGAVGWDGASLLLLDPEGRPAARPRQFYRLRLLLEE